MHYEKFQNLTLTVFQTILVAKLQNNIIKQMFVLQKRFRKQKLKIHTLRRILETKGVARNFEGEGYLFFKKKPNPILVNLF